MLELNERRFAAFINIGFEANVFENLPRVTEFGRSVKIGKED